jgi:5-methylcytosine-specific restriction endonuclease McrA
MKSIPLGLRRQIVFRAGDRCEYCGLAQEGQEATFHIDHIVPAAVGGPTTADNLALACVSCSLRKEARRSGRDPQTGRIVSLFNPRR